MCVRRLGWPGTRAWSHGRCVITCQRVERGRSEEEAADHLDARRSRMPQSAESVATSAAGSMVSQRTVAAARCGAARLQVCARHSSRA